jgi:hypothetical protein
MKGAGDSMSLFTVLLPLLVQVALTFVLLFWLQVARRNAVTRGEIKFAGAGIMWPQRVSRLDQAYTSQTELPVLFYLLVVLALMARRADYLFVALAWVFVAFRFVHAYCILFEDGPARRFFAFLIGAVVLAALWVLFVIALVAGF